MSKQKTIDRKQSTFIQIQPSISKVSKFIISVLKHFKWAKVTLIVGKGHRYTSSIWNQTAQGLRDMTSEYDIEVTQMVYFIEEPTVHFKPIIDSTYQNTRGTK